jgi:ribonucleoside-diphosphate reductase alpha chain
MLKIDKKIVGWKIEKNDEQTSVERPTKIVAALSPKRPKELPCDIHHITYKGQKWIALVGLLDNIPYELFTGYSNLLSLPSKCNKGRILKSTRGVYDLYVDINGEDLIIKNIIKTFNNPENAWSTRILSTCLRHGIPIDFIVDQLSKDGGIGDINKVLSRVLKKYIKEGSSVRSGAKCESCNSSNLIYSEGCIRCLDCGWAKCG